MTAWAWPASRVLRVVDGDTLDAQVTRDIGFGGTVSFPIRLRLARINATPLATPDGKAARDFLVALLPAVVDLSTGKPYKYGGPDDEDGEWMAEIILADGRNVSDLMVASGHAVPWNGEGPRPGG